MTAEQLRIRAAMTILTFDACEHIIADEPDGRPWIGDLERRVIECRRCMGSAPDQDSDSCSYCDLPGTRRRALFIDVGQMVIGGDACDECYQALIRPPTKQEQPK